MEFLLNLILGIVAGFLADFILGRMKVTDPIKVILAVLIGIVVFLADLAERF